MENQGMQWNWIHNGLTDWGGSPTLIEPVIGKITLRNLDGAKSVFAQPLDGSGQPFGPPLPASKTLDGWAIAIGTPATTWYEVIVQR